MIFRGSRLWRLSLLLAPALFAQEPHSIRQIESALTNGLYPQAEQRIWEALSIRQTPDEESALTVLLIRALAGQQKFNDAVILADESSSLSRQDGLLYWKARALFEAGRFGEVFQPLEKLPATSPYAPAALRLKGRAERAAGNLQAAQKSFETFLERFPADMNAGQNRLDLSEIYLANGKDGQAKAAELLAPLAASETADVSIRSVAWVRLAAIRQLGGNLPEAADALAKAEKLTTDPVARIRLKAARAGLLADEKKTFALFDEAVKESPDTSTASDVLVLKAESMLKAGLFPVAEKTFQAALDIASAPALQIRAQTGKGWSLWEQKRYEEAALSFETAAQKCRQPAECVTALIKAGDARLAAGQYEKARDNYRRVTENHPDHPLAAQAMYQSAAAALAAGKTNTARGDFELTEQKFPQSPFAPQAALQLAGLQKRDQLWAAALEQYRRIAGQYTNAAMQAAALHNQGLVLYRLGDRDAALLAFRTVSEKFPDTPEAPQATYMQGFCRYLKGDVEEALAICQAFIKKYPDSAWTPEVLFWLAEHYYNRGVYSQAHSAFLDISTRFPKHELADDALFWAGNALFKQDKFLAAFTLYGRLAKEYPGSPQLLKTRFAQGETLTELGEFPRAILAYEEVIKTSPDDPLADRARGRLADCLFTLGTAEASRYQEALEAYQALYKRPAVPFALKLQSLYKMARCKEKTGAKEGAIAHYMEAVNSVAAQKEKLSPDAALWFSRAALDAAVIQEQQQQWKEAADIYRRICEAGVPAGEAARKRMEQLKAEHPVAF
jgi:tetratricopeptide (TPR) repeat protein